MTDIVNNVVDKVTSAPTNMVSGITSDVTGTKFYKSPVFYTWVIYVGVLIGIYVSMHGHLKTYFFGNNTDLSFIDLYTYPYGIKEPQNIIKTVVSNPIILFGTIFTLLYPSLMNVNKPGSQPFYYAAMMAIIMVIILFMIHVAVFKFIVKPETIEIPSEFAVKKRTGNTYADLYKGHWVSLFSFSPIYAFVMVYLARKL